MHRLGAVTHTAINVTPRITGTRHRIRTRCTASTLIGRRNAVRSCGVSESL